jgi:hypothetical protein
VSPVSGPSRASYLATAQPLPYSGSTSGNGGLGPIASMVNSLGSQSPWLTPAGLGINPARSLAYFDTALPEIVDVRQTTSPWDYVDRVVQSADDLTWGGFSYFTGIGTAVGQAKTFLPRLEPSTVYEFADGTTRIDLVGIPTAGDWAQQGIAWASLGGSAWGRATTIATAPKTTSSGLGTTAHGVNQKITRGVTSAAELDALKHPLRVGPIKTDSLGRPSQRFIGEKAEVVINPQTGKIVSVNPTSSKKAAQLKGRGN